ncbi:sulfite exporter TauE/SafE family protein [Stieleria varia]|uniref:Urease accessory protein UreH-like transmembrane domain-containing protein n=1 Tax=Stieleria varia TaxID=2528005 RepID=A0A5C6ARX3_9BACT|nr:sulfite exporter TauE/SafE family protein [Stieleria varia]TWU02450.1 hypothetical protein Pla52n_35000 [Stieleria varia]
MTANVLILLSAVVTSSLMGSLHCVGMCGPLALWASGAGDKENSRSLMMPTSLYHVGRLITYTIVGLIAGLIGAAVDFGGGVLGLQVAAARVVGGLMVAIGLIKLWSMLGKRSASKELKPSRIGGLLAKVRPYVFRLPISARALATGMLTTLLPCGWLYLFALIAAGTGSPWTGALLMIAFWVGTVPALVALVAGTRVLSRKFTRAIPAVAAVLLICAGCFTASGRGLAGMSSFGQSMIPEGDSLEQVQNVDQETLPCCRTH